MRYYQHIPLDKDAAEHMAKFTLNRPERLNAMKMAAAAETKTLTSQDRAPGTVAIRESRKPVYEDR